MATFTFYPDAGTGGTTVDGGVNRSSVSESFATIRAGAGVTATPTVQNGPVGQLRATATTDEYHTVQRSIFLFDSSALGSGATILSAVFSLNGTFALTSLGEDSIDIVSSSPASDSNLVTGDYAQLGSTSFSNLTTVGWAVDSYNDFTLNAGGISNISKTGISKFGARLEQDRTGTLANAWASNGQTRVDSYFADWTGTTKDPKLTITTPSTDTGNFFLFF